MKMVILVHQNECCVVLVRTVTIAMKPSWFLWIYANYHYFPPQKIETQEKQEKKDLVFAMQIYNVEHQNYQFTCMCIIAPSSE